MHYSFCFWSLQPDEALVVRLAVPAARYWSLQLYQLGWFEWLDLGRPTSLNQVQIAAGEDGVTIVLAATDPGISNWLDTEGPDRRAAHLPWRVALSAGTGGDHAGREAGRPRQRGGAGGAAV